MITRSRRSPESKPGARPSGAPCWVELKTADLPRTKIFYGELFGWRRDNVPSVNVPADNLPASAGHPEQVADQPGYSVAVKNDVAVAGITTLRLGARVLTACWTTSLAVSRVDEAVSRVGEYGGSVTMDLLMRSIPLGSPKAVRGDAEPLERRLREHRHRRHSAARGRAEWVNAVRSGAHTDRADDGMMDPEGARFSLWVRSRRTVDRPSSSRSQPQRRRAVHRCPWYAERELTAGGLL